MPLQLFNTTAFIDGTIAFPPSQHWKAWLQVSVDVPRAPPAITLGASIVRVHASVPKSLLSYARFGDPLIHRLDGSSELASREWKFSLHESLSHYSEQPETPCRLLLVVALVHLMLTYRIGNGT